MFNDIYFLVLNENNPELIKDKLKNMFVDEQQPYPPFLTVSGVLALNGIDEKVALLRTLGASANFTAQGYALAGNHNKVEEYRTTHHACVNNIAQGYALAGNHNKVEEYRTQHQACVNVIAQGYALAGNHNKVEDYRTQHPTCVHSIVRGYALAGNHNQVEKYRTQHHASVHFIAPGYAQGGNHNKVEEYRTKHQAFVNFIAQGYAEGGNHNKVEEYRTQYHASIDSIIYGYTLAGNRLKTEAYRTLKQQQNTILPSAAMTVIPFINQQHLPRVNFSNQLPEKFQPQSQTTYPQNQYFSQQQIQPTHTLNQQQKLQQQQFLLRIQPQQLQLFLQRLQLERQQQELQQSRVTTPNHSPVTLQPHSQTTYPQNQSLIHQPIFSMHQPQTIANPGFGYTEQTPNSSHNNTAPALQPGKRPNSEFLSDTIVPENKKSNNSPQNISTTNSDRQPKLQSMLQPAGFFAQMNVQVDTPIEHSNQPVYQHGSFTPIKQEFISVKKEPVDNFI
jgi:hypothetical protein